MIRASDNFPQHAKIAWAFMHRCKNAARRFDATDFCAKLKAW
jgi:hypothetical protein